MDPENLLVLKATKHVTRWKTIHWKHNYSIDHKLWSAAKNNICVSRASKQVTKIVHFGQFLCNFCNFEVTLAHWRRLGERLVVKEINGQLVVSTNILRTFAIIGPVLNFWPEAKKLGQKVAKFSHNRSLPFLLNCWSHEVAVDPKLTPE